MIKKRTALIVDDDSTLRYVLARLARQSGYEVLEANDGTSALEIATSKSPHVIVADVRLPDFDGFELCRRIKAEKATKAIPTILVTSMYYQSGNSTREIADGKKHAKSVGALDLLLRGEALEQLRPLLEGLARPKRVKSRKAR